MHRTYIPEYSVFSAICNWKLPFPALLLNGHVSKAVTTVHMATAGPGSSELKHSVPANNKIELPVCKTVYILFFTERKLAKRTKDFVESQREKQKKATCDVIFFKMLLNFWSLKENMFTSFSEIKCNQSTNRIIQSYNWLTDNDYLVYMFATPIGDAVSRIF